MNVKRLFNLQKSLEEHIVREKKLQGRDDLLPSNLLSLQVELGELANEWRGFKFWSCNRSPRRSVPVLDSGQRLIRHSDPLLEEYVDCLSFILVIGLDLGLNDFDVSDIIDGKKDSTVKMFLDLTGQVYALYECVSQEISWQALDLYHALFTKFIALGFRLGLTLDEIEKAYMAKNTINHERQCNGY